METLDFTYAQTVQIKIDRYATLPLIGTFTDTTDPNAVVDVDLTNYGLEFELRENNLGIASYFIKQGDLTSTFLTKQGTNNRDLDTTKMWVDIKLKLQKGQSYTLLMIQTTPAGKTFVAIKFLIVVTDY